MSDYLNSCGYGKIIQKLTTFLLTTLLNLVDFIAKNVLEIGERVKWPNFD